MSALFEAPAKLSLAQKFSRLGDRMRDPEWRRFGKTLLLGKIAGLAVLALAISRAQARGELPDHQVRVRRPGNLAGDAGGPGGHGQKPRHQPAQHRLGSARRVPRIRHAGRLHDAGSRLLPESRDRQRARRVHVRHVRLRAPALGLRLRLHVRRRQRLHRLAHARRPDEEPDLHEGRRGRSRYGACGIPIFAHYSSSSPLRTAPRRSARARWSAGRASSATSSIRSAYRASSTRSSVTGAGVPMASSPRWARRAASSRASE